MSDFSSLNLDLFSDSYTTTSSVIDVQIEISGENERELYSSIPLTKNTFGLFEVGKALLSILCLISDFEIISYYSPSQGQYTNSSNSFFSEDWLLEENEIIEFANRKIIYLKGSLKTCLSNPIKSEPEKTTIVESNFSPSLPEKKKTRTKQPEKSIKQVLELLKAWRETFDREGSNGRSLIDRASNLGVPKKSLDDYNRMVKHARNLGFNFDKNISEGFGFLRKYVKERQDKKEVKIDDDISTSVTEKSEKSDFDVIMSPPMIK